MNDSDMTEQQIAIRDAIERKCRKYDAKYWRDRDEDGRYPEEFVREIAEDGWLGIAIPTEYGGSGLGLTEACIMMQTICGSGAGFSGGGGVHINIFGLSPVVKYGTEEQKHRMLPPLIRGEDRACFGVTEPDAGLDTAQIETRAVLDGDRYIVNGRKIWTSTAQTANKILLLARTKPKAECEKPIDGLSLFYTDLDRNYVEVKRIPKMGRKAVDSNSVFIDGLPIPKDDLIGEEGKGFRYILSGMNAERILIAAETVGVGRAALKRAVDYARERVVFGRPIGQNQGIQHPLAESWAQLEAADLMCYRAAKLFDEGRPCAAEANAAKYLSAEAGFTACERAVLTHGGMGYAKEYDVERLFREVFLARIAPVTKELILSYIGEHVLGLPKSY